MKTRTLSILSAGAILAAALAVVLLTTGTGKTQSSPSSLTIGIYAPTVEFGTSQQRLQYVQGLAKAIESQTGVNTTAQSYTSLSALKRAGVDFAIVDGQCYATNQSWKLLATAQVDGGTSRSWALYSSVGGEMQALRGKKLAYVQTGCRDNDFIDHAMLESEVDASFFSGRVGKPDLTAAVAEVKSYKGAQAVFAPSGASKGLTKVFDTGSVPNPAFVQINGKLSSSITSKVQNAVTGYGGGGAISGWTNGNRGLYTGLSGRMGRSVKRGVFAPPEPVRFDAKDVLIDPPTLDDTENTPVDQHFDRPRERLD